MFNGTETPDVVVISRPLLALLVPKGKTFAPAPKDSSEKSCVVDVPKTKKKLKILFKK